MSWNDWNAHVLACRGVGAGGIFSQAGAVCAQSGFNVTAEQIKAIGSVFSGAAASVTIGDKKFMVLTKDDTSFQGRASGCPLTVFKTNTLFIVAVGKADANGGNLALDCEKVANMLKQSNL